MIATSIFNPKLTQVLRTSWQLLRISLQVEISTTGGAGVAGKPQAMGEAACQ